MHTQPHHHQVSLAVIVNGQPVEVKAAPDSTLRHVAEKALHESGNSGQPLDNWELRDAAGQILDWNRSVEHYHLADGAKLFLNLKAGVGG